MKKWMFYSLIGIFGAVFLVCAFLLIDYFTESKKQEKVYNELSQIYREDATAPIPQDEEPVKGGMLPEFDRLYEMNDEIVGWIRIDGTEVDYPVMQTPAIPDYYLNKNFHKEKSSHGCIYAYNRCDIFAPSDNITIYGHNMKDGSMFADLKHYQKKSYWEKHATVQFNTLYEKHEYEIFAVFTTTASKGKGFRYHTFIDAYDQSEFNSFVATCKELSLYDTGITPQYGDKLITLSTCEYSQTNGRLVVMARRIG